MKYITTALAILISIFALACPSSALTALEEATQYKTGLMQDAVLAIGLYQRTLSDIDSVLTPPAIDSTGKIILSKGLTACFNAPLETNNDYHLTVPVLTQDASADDLANWGNYPQVQNYYLQTRNAVLPCPKEELARTNQYIDSLETSIANELRDKMDRIAALRVHLRSILTSTLPPLITKLQNSSATMNNYVQKQTAVVQAVSKNPYASPADKQNSQQDLYKINAIKVSIQSFSNALLPIISPLPTEIDADIKELQGRIGKTWEK